ncbi:MAG: cation:proton antiporter subunit C [Chloroflexota bacterium]|nr:cation:proton antiporter subunit C [Chloroflexota bacterium]MDE2684048.1 cation:proton antiporter subunit C [Chloroflexota bacterium]
MDELAARFPYFMIAILLAVGVWGMVGKRNLVKKLIGLNVLQSAIILFFISGSLRDGGTVPILFPGEHGKAEDFVNPLPHVLMLTAIVVSVAVTAVALAFLKRIHREFGTVDEAEILSEMESQS